MVITHLIGKKILSIYEGQVVGTVSQIVFSKNYDKVKGFIFFDNDENEYFIHYKNIFAMADNVLIKNINQIQTYFDTEQISPLFKEVIDVNGQGLGKLVDAEIENNGIVKFFLTIENKLKPQDLLLTNNFIICYLDKKYKLSDFKPRVKSIMDNANTQEIKVKILQMGTPEKQEVSMPKKISFNPYSLIGKKAKSGLLGQNNEIIIKPEQLITQKIVEEATRHSRLNQLYFIAK